jgi:hypothetical protein
VAEPLGEQRVDQPAVARVADQVPLVGQPAGGDQHGVDDVSQQGTAILGARLVS